jgi:dipeptidyl aminopeptidase/acylaminoacyl peptidase
MFLSNLPGSGLRNVLLALLIVFWGAGDLSPPASAATAKRPLSIDDMLRMEHLDRATLSPDGEWIAVVVLRPATAGAVFGRSSYESDPTRSDVWLISAKTGARRLIANGQDNAAGYWCATWSPDGQRLALLSTEPKGKEPRGGDNVRLYVWDRASGRLSRLIDDAVMTQTRYGSAVDKLDLRGGADRGTVAHGCNKGPVGENAPFLWLDSHRLLAVTLPRGSISAAIDHYTRPYRIAERDAVRLRNGMETTVSAVASGDARAPREEDGETAILRVIDVPAHRQYAIGTVPAYPFRGGLTVSVSPDGKRLALFPTIGALRPQGGRTFANFREDAWQVERRLGFVDLATGVPTNWVTMPSTARYPLELFGWSPNGRSVAFRARSDPFTDTTPLFIADAEDGSVQPLGSRSIGNYMIGGGRPVAPAARWVSNSSLLTRTSDDKWLVLGRNGVATDVGNGKDVPSPESFARAGDGSLMALVGKTLLRFDPTRAMLLPAAQVDGEASFLPGDSDTPASRRLILLHRPDNSFVFSTLDGATGKIGAFVPAFRADFHDTDVERSTILYSQSSGSGTTLREVTIGGRNGDVMRINAFLDEIDWGDVQIVDYSDAGGARLHAAVIFPPGYQPGRRYPTLVWVYGGYQVQSLDGEYMTDLLQPGLNNLRLYAAKGYVILVPSIPLDRSDRPTDVYTQMLKGVMPAVDQLIASGIADPERLGVFGQSFGGYSVYALVGQTNRFKAAVTMAGLTDLTSLVGEFDPTARGYAGIEHEKSDNWAETGQFGEPAPPWIDAAGYGRNSPLSYVANVTTPLLMIHGEFDIRGPQTQAEQFFYALYAQGKTARLLRYGGESHNLAQSPANIRDAFANVIAWFDRYLRPTTKNPDVK